MEVERGVSETRHEPWRDNGGMDEIVSRMTDNSISSLDITFFRVQKKKEEKKRNDIFLIFSQKNNY